MSKTYEEYRVEELKELVFDKYFGKRVIKYPVSRNGQEIDTHIEIRDERLSYHLHELTVKYDFKQSQSDILTEYVFQAFKAIQKFTPESDNEAMGWEAILDESNELLVNQLNKYIKINTEHAMWQFVNPNAMKTSRTTVDGEKIHYIMVMEMEGLDYLLGDEGEDNPPIQLTDENHLFDATIYDFHVSYFQKWFNEKKDDFLHPSQLKFLEDLKKLSKDHHLTAEEFEETTGVKWRDYSKRMRRLEQAIIRAWEAHQPTQKSRRQISLEPKIEYLQGFLNLLEDMMTDKDINTQNIRLTDYLVEGMLNKKTEYEMFQITNQVYELDELTLFNRIVKNKNEKRVFLSAVSIMKVAKGMEEMLESLHEQLNNEYKQVDAITYYDKPEEIIEREELEKTHITTYDENGNVKARNIRMVKSSLSNGNVYYLTPTGAMTRKRP